MKGYLIAVIILACPCGSSLLAQTLAAPPIADTQVAPPASSKPAVKLSFPMGEGVGRGDGIYLPVAVGGKERLFLMDTGLTETVLDAALVKELSLKSLPATSVSPATGDAVTMEQYASPTLALGGVTLASTGSAVVGHDLESIRHVLGRPIEGVLGMDVLRNYVVRLDFKEHQVDIGDLAVGRDAGERLAMDWAPNGLPRIAARFFDVPDVLVVPDTGNANVVILNRVILDRLPPDECLANGKSPNADASGTVMAAEYRITTKWSLAGTSFHELQVDQGNFCSMGLGMMRDYVVTFDFPRNNVYLRSIEPAGKDQPRNAIHLLMDGKRVVVDRLEQGIPDVGLEVHDEITRVDGKNATDMQLWAIREHLATAEHTTLTIRRGSSAKELTLRVDGRYPEESRKRE